MATFSGTPSSSSSWIVTARTILRTMLNDAGADTYTNERLNALIMAAAYYLPMEINFSSSYVIDITNESVSPDPLDQTDGTDFISLAALKAACLLDESAFRTAALLQGVQARCGPAVLTTNSYGQYLKDLLSAGPCKTYETLKHEFNFGYKGSTILRAVMSPFVSNGFYPPNSVEGGSEDLGNYHRQRGS